MKKEMMFISLISPTLILGCANNHISGGLYNGVWAGKSTLISNTGSLFKGDTTFNVAFKDGTISFSESPWGIIEGKFTYQDQSTSVTSTGVNTIFMSNKSIPISNLQTTNINTKSNSGKAYLATNNQVVLLCNITGQFITTGNLDYEMTGTGVCADNKNNQYTLILDRSTSQ
jgi:hypothetical protein